MDELRRDNVNATTATEGTTLPHDDDPTERGDTNEFESHFTRDDGDYDAGRVANVAVYGFVCYLGTCLYYIFVLVWGFLPEPMLHSIGLTYYPQKYWAIGLPAWGCLSGVLMVLIYCCVNFISAAPLDSPLSHCDEHSNPSTASARTLTTEGSIPVLISDFSVEEWNQLLFDRQKQH